jgi:hypothetical protein
MYYPAITTAALFTAIIIVDAIKKYSSNIPSHAFLGLLSVGAMLFLSMKGADFVAWGILVLPMFIIILSFVLVYTGSPIVSAAATSTSPVAAAKTTSAATTASAASTPSKTALVGQTVQIPSTKPTVTSVTPSTSSCAPHV